SRDVPFPVWNPVGSRAVTATGAAMSSRAVSEIWFRVRRFPAGVPPRILPGNPAENRFHLRTAPMQSTRTSFPLTAVLLLVLAVPAAGQMETVALRQLEHEDYEIWNRIGAQSLSHDGRWALFTLSSEKNDGTLTVVEAAGNTRHVIDRAESPVFSPDNRFVAFTIKPAKAVLEEERKKDTPASRMPPDTLGILDLRTGAITRVARVRGFRMPEEAGGWIAYQLGRAPEEKTDS